MSNSLDPDQARQTVGPDLGPNYLQRLSADDISRQRVIYCLNTILILTVLFFKNYIRIFFKCYFNKINSVCEGRKLLLNLVFKSN